MKYIIYQTTNLITVSLRKEAPYKTYQFSLEYKESLPSTTR